MISAVNVFQFLVVKTLDPDRYSAQNAGSGSVLNEYRSETLFPITTNLKTPDTAMKLILLLAPLSYRPESSGSILRLRRPAPHRHRCGAQQEGQAQEGHEQQGRRQVQQDQNL